MQSTIDRYVCDNISDQGSIIVAMFIDNILVFTYQVKISYLFNDTLSQYFPTKDLETVKKCFGVYININYKENWITLDQKYYIDCILKRFHRISVYQVTHPAPGPDLIFASS